MKEVRSFILYSDGSDKEATDGIIIALAKMMWISEEELRLRLNICIYPHCHCAVAFPKGHRPGQTECPRSNG